MNRGNDRLLTAGLMGCLFVMGCSGSDPLRKSVFPVTGEIYVDGQPAESLAVRCFDVNGIDSEQPTLSSTFTDSSGRFTVSTYESGDGVPKGEYVLTFEWGEWNVFARSYGGPDKLEGRYIDPESSEFTVSVTGDGPVDLGRIELSTKP